MINLSQNHESVHTSLTNRKLLRSEIDSSKLHNLDRYHHICTFDSINCSKITIQWTNLRIDWWTDIFNSVNRKIIQTWNRFIRNLNLNRNDDLNSFNSEIYSQFNIQLIDLIKRMNLPWAIFSRRNLKNFKSIS